MRNSCYCSLVTRASGLMSAHDSSLPQSCAIENSSGVEIACALVNPLQMTQKRRKHYRSYPESTTPLTRLKLAQKGRKTRGALRFSALSRLKQATVVTARRSFSLQSPVPLVGNKQEWGFREGDCFEIRHSAFLLNVVLVLKPVKVPNNAWATLYSIMKSKIEESDRMKSENK